MIEVIDLVKEYNGKPVVNHLTIRVERGEIYGFLGPNGAGKSTTIAMLLGLVRPTKGIIKLFGRLLTEDFFRIKSRIGVVTESQHFYGEMSGQKYLEFFAALYGVKNSKQKIFELLDLLDLIRFCQTPLRAYSKGMQQKLAFARALIHDPDLIILDEPTSSLDPFAIKQVREIILMENKKGKTFFLSSHLLSEVERICHRIAIINQGVLVAEDTMDGLKRRMSKEMEIEIELEGATKDLLSSLITNLSFVRDAHLNGNFLTVRTHNQEDHRAVLTHFLTDHGCTILSMVRKPISLEEAFITITENNLPWFIKRGS